jgi:hypothetical protein
MASNEISVSLNFILDKLNSFVRDSHNASSRFISLFFTPISVLAFVEGDGEHWASVTWAPIIAVFTERDSLSGLATTVLRSPTGVLFGVEAWSLLTRSGVCRACKRPVLLLVVFAERMLVEVGMELCSEVLELMDRLETSDMILVLLETAARPSRDL